MEATEVYARTAKGLVELSKKKLDLPMGCYELLEMVDGQANLQKIRSGQEELSEKSFDYLFRVLIQHGLIQLLHSFETTDILGPAWDDQLSVNEISSEDAVQAWAEARRGAQELKEKGYFHTTIQPEKLQGAAKILVVEDDPLMAEIELSLLFKAGFLTKLVDCGKDVPGALACYQPDLMILDVSLPDTTGFEILAQLRRSKDYANLPIVIVTAHGEAESIMHGLRGGADGYIIKPFHPEALVHCLRKVLNIPG